jgi:hypothetical protein
MKNYLLCINDIKHYFKNSCINGNFEFVKYLYNLYPEKKFLNDNFQNACGGGNFALVMFIVTYGNPFYSIESFYNAIRSFNFEIVKFIYTKVQKHYLLDSKIILNKFFNYGMNIHSNKYQIELIFNFLLDMRIITIEDIQNNNKMDALFKMINNYCCKNILDKIIQIGLSKEYISEKCKGYHTIIL